MQCIRFGRRLAFWLIILTFSFTLAQAQTSNGDDAETKNKETQTNAAPAQSEADDYAPKTQIGFWGGTYTVHKDLLGASARSRFGLVAVRYSRVIMDKRPVRLKYTVDAVPLAILNFKRERYVQATPTTVVVERDRRTAYGVGFSPFGLQLNFRNRKKVQPYLGGHLGLLIFNRPVPDNRSGIAPSRSGVRLNFTGDIGVGVEIGLKNKKSLLLGYKYYHISNAYRGEVNIGYNTNMVYGGFNFGR